MGFIDALVRAGLIKDTQVSEILSRAEKKYSGDIDRAIMDFGISENELLNIKSSYFNIPIKDMDPKDIPFSILKYIPEDSAKLYKFVPVGMKDGVLEVGIVDPDNIQATDALQFITTTENLPFRYFLVKQSFYDAVIANYQGLSGEVDKAISDIGAQSDIMNIDTSEVVIESIKPQSNLKPGEEAKIVEDAPIVKIVDVIISHAIEGSASDIHIENVGTNVKVRFRVDGILYTSLVLPLNVYAGIIARIKIQSKLRLDEKRIPQDGGFSARVDGRKVDFRVSTFPSYYGEKIVMRILDQTRGVKPINGLDLSTRHLDMVSRALKRPYGLILITGPTGSGKTTTLYSMLNELDREKTNVVSLEDPVEYHMEGVNQSEIMPEIGYTFASGLRSILRQDPDIIMVGEIRDKETAQLAIQAALTGHLVFSTLHTNTAIGAIPRLIDMGIDPYLIAPTLLLTIGQRLVRVACPTSKKEVPIDESTQLMIDKQFKDLPKEFEDEIPNSKTMYEITPSPDCPLGTRGRIPVFEMFETDDDVKKIILENPTEIALYSALRKKGMISMKEDAILKALKGNIPMQEVFGL
jgi:type IV pilus assembly protein PilB